MGEGAGLKSAIETGKKPEWGFCLGGYKYNITQFDAAFEDGDNTFATLFAQRPKMGVFCCSTGSQIVAGFYSEEKGQSPGNCKKAVLAFWHLSEKHWVLRSGRHAWKAAGVCTRESGE